MAVGELGSLDPDARLVLAVLAVVGRGSLSIEELGEISELPDARQALAELEQRGLVVGEGDRRALAPGARGRLQRLLASVDVVDRVLRGFIAIAEDGRLTIGDLDAVVALTRIAAETGRWAQLLRLAEAAERTLSTTRRIEEWVEIVERRLEAAGALGDSQAAGRAKQELDRARASARRVAGGAPTALAVLVAAAVGAVGFGGGYLTGDQSSTDGDAGTITTTESKTETVTDTETAPAETVTDTVTETTTVTVTEVSGGSGGVD